MTSSRLDKLNGWLRTALVVSGISFLGLVVTAMISPCLFFIVVEGVLFAGCVGAALILRWLANNEQGF